MVLEQLFIQNAASMGGGTELSSAMLDALSNEHNQQLTLYTEYRNYWNGDQRVRLTDRLKQFLRANGFRNFTPQNMSTDFSPFSDNFCGVVVSALADRLNVESFAVPGEPAGAPVTEGGEATAGVAATAFQRWWELNKGETLQNDVHRFAAALGDAYVFVEYDPIAKRPSFTYNPPELIRVQYDSASYERMLYVTKRWVVMEPSGNAKRGSVRMNVYWPDRIEKYIADAIANSTGSWRHYDEPGEPWPLPWVDAKGEALGIPAFHFKNDDRGGMYGRSELADALPLQDALNKALVDAIKIMDSQGWQQRWGTGLDEKPDDDAAAAPGSMLWSTSQDAKFGQFDAADPAGVVLWLEHLIDTISHVTSTPGYMFRSHGPDIPSGEALKTAEAPLVQKAKNRQTKFQDVWEGVAEMAVRLNNANVGVVEGVVLIDLPDTGFDVEWVTAESRPSELERISAINAKVGLSERQRLREYGYDEETIQRIRDEFESEQTTMAQIMGTTFDAGAQK